MSEAARTDPLESEASGLSVSVLICTRNRPESIGAAVASVLADPGTTELIVIDQSDGEATADALAELCSDRRLTYHRSTTRGVAAGRNEAARLSHGEVLAYTDDDCRVQPGWQAGFAEVFREYPRVGVTFGNVIAVEYSPAHGFVPDYVSSGTTLATTMREKCRRRGIGASMSVRRAAFDDIGGFDEALGPGGPFHACEDGDIAVRGILRGWWVCETDRATVLHDGFRRHERGRDQSGRDWFGIGAAYVKPIRNGHPRVLAVFAYEAWVAVRKPLGSLIRTGRPVGARQILRLLRGAWAGWRTPVDRATLRYRREAAERH